MVNLDAQRLTPSGYSSAVIYVHWDVNDVVRGGMTLDSFSYYGLYLLRHSARFRGRKIDFDARISLAGFPLWAYRMRGMSIMYCCTAVLHCDPGG